MGIVVDGDGWHVSSNLYDVEPEYDWSTNTLKYGDLFITNYQRTQHGTHRMIVSIIGGLTCE